MATSKQTPKINDAVTDSGNFKPNERLADAPVNAPGAGVAGAKAVGEPDKNAGAKTTPELPVVNHPDKASFAEEPAADAVDGAPAEAPAEAPAKKGKAGTVTYRFADGSTVTNEVDDVNNPPAVAHDEHGQAEVVKE